MCGVIGNKQENREIISVQYSSFPYQATHVYTHNTWCSNPYRIMRYRKKVIRFLEFFSLPFKCLWHSWGKLKLIFFMPPLNSFDKVQKISFLLIYSYHRPKKIAQRHFKFLICSCDNQNNNDYLKMYIYMCIRRQWLHQWVIEYEVWVEGVFKNHSVATALPIFFAVLMKQWREKKNAKMTLYSDF